MRLVTVLSLLIACGCLAGATFADPGAPGDEKPWTYDFSGIRAVYPEAEPNDVCPGQTMACGDMINPGQIASGTDVDFYQVFLTAGDWVTIGTDASDLGDPDLGDSYIHLYAPDCVTQVAFDDDGGPSLYSLITNYLVPVSGIYNIKVRGYSASYTGYYKMWVECVTPPPPPQGDTCADPFTIVRCTTGTITGDLTGMLNHYSPQPPSPGCTGYSAAGKDAVYRIDFEAGDIFNVVYNTPSHDGSIYLITDCASPGATCVIGEDDPEPETFTYTVLTTGTYYLIVDCFSTNAGGPYTIDYSITCQGPTAACCFPDGSCQVLQETACVAQGGTWYAGALCSPNPCPQPATGACCRNGDCVIMTNAQCVAGGGDYYGDNVPCEPNPCPPNPTEQSSWGKIKNQYR